MVLASDAVHFYANMTRANPFPVIVDVGAYLESHRRLAALADSAAHIVPGHDPQVLQRYPALSEQTRGVVHRVDVARLDN